MGDQCRKLRPVKLENETRGFLGLVWSSYSMATISTAKELFPFNWSGNQFNRKESTMRKCWNQAC